MSSLLEIRNLKTRFYTHEGVVHAVNGVSLTLDKGETLGIVGESGCGKSVTMLSVLRLIPSPPGKIEAGEVLFAGRNLLRLTEPEMERIRGAEIAMIFQDPMTSLNPTLTVGHQIAEALRLHQGLGKRAATAQAAELLSLVGIPKACERLGDYPHQFSGGMRQRAMVAMALSCHPQLLIADEPTTALDVTVQAQILDLVRRLQAQFGMTVIWITHDLGVVARLVQRVMVMYAGYVVEDAPVDRLYASPRHPYTQGLLGSLPRRTKGARSRLVSIPGQPPSLVARGSQDRGPGQGGCPFAPRCRYTTTRCNEENPVLVPATERSADGIRQDTVHFAACWEQERAQGEGHGV
jgi:oligopeptide transport system ATP-binding protein